MTKTLIQATVQKNSAMTTDFSAVGDFSQSASNESEVAGSANDDSLELENSQNATKNDDSAELLN